VASLASASKLVVAILASVENLKVCVLSSFMSMVVSGFAVSCGSVVESQSMATSRLVVKSTSEVSCTKTVNSGSLVHLVH
jgi:hypothetical protein